jgi:RHS repeat-associated protein
VTSTRTEPSGWSVTRSNPDAKNAGSAQWPGGSGSYTLTAHPRLGSGVLVPESTALTYNGVTGHGALHQDTTQSFSTDFTPAVGYSTPNTETVTATVTPASGTARSRTAHFDAATRTTTVTSPESRQSAYVLDAQSRIVRLELPGQVPTVYGYDGQGYLQTVSRTKGTRTRLTTFGYDARGYVDSVGNKVSETVTDEVTMDNDAMGFATGTSVPGLLSVGSTPDIAGALSTLTPDSKPAHQLSYTPLGQLSEYASPAGTLSTDGSCEPGTQCWHYSLDRELEDLTLPDGTMVDYVYDPVKGTLSSVEVPGHGVTTFGYDSVGRRDSASAPSGGTMSFSWQSTLPIRSSWQGTHTVTDGASTVWSGTLDGTVERFYNDFVEVSELHVPGGASVRLLRDKDGLVTNVEDVGGVLPTLTLSRSAFDGHVDGTTLGVVTTSHTLDVSATTPGFGDLLAVSTDAGATDLYDAAYTYDDRGRIDTWTETVLGSTQARKLHYDGAGRLVEVEDLQSGATLEEYAYDGNGNRQKAVSTGLSADLGVNLGCASPSGDTAANDQDQLCRYGDFEYRYNARGQLEERERVSDGAVTGYTYDGLGRLKKVVTEAGLPIHYVHDALGRRTGKIVDGQLDRGWLYADALNPIAQLDRDGNIEATFVYGTRAHVPDAMAMADGTMYRFITDHLGSVRLMVNAGDGTVVQRLAYDAFGRVLNDSNPGFQPFGFAGGLYDADTGLVRFGTRDYDSDAGRWTNKDLALANGGTANLYEYAYNDPINFIDADGTIPIAIWGIAIALVFLESDTQFSGADLLGVTGIPWCGALIGKAASRLAGGGAKLSLKFGPKIVRQIGRRGWTPRTIEEAVSSGSQFRAVNKATGNPATRYVHPTTGQSVVVDNVTGEVIHVGGPGFRYGAGSGDLP